ncbi:MAG: hypothetical protein ACR2NU_09515 [Aeoliella sp.]
MRESGHFDHNSWFVRCLNVALVGGGVCLAPSTRAADRDIASSVVAQQGTEQSVLVATRKVDQPSETNDGDDALQPISATSDKEPVLAAPEPTLAPSPAGNRANRAIKMAANTSPDSRSDETASVAEKNARTQPAVFHGIQPGVSTKKELLAAWGAPQEAAPTETGQLLSYNLESFRGVDVLIEEDVVALMKINLRQPEPPLELAKKVQANPSEAVEVADDRSGQVLAYAYPEQGIVLVLDQSEEITPVASSTVSQMLLQPLEAPTFNMRAEQRLRRECSGRIADLKRAISIAPGEAHAHWLLADALLQIGRAGPAEAAARRAVEINPENVAYRQRWGECLAAVGSYDDAVLKTREVLDQKNAPTIVRARAMHQMGLLASLGDSSISKKAVGFHTMAIEEADTLATSDNVKLRREAKRLLVEAHLAVALDVSRREYDGKLDNVAQWVSRASGFAEELIANDGGELDLRVRVAQQSLAALSGFKPANDPEPLLQEILDTIEEIKAEADDPLWLEQLEWATGVAYLRALQIEHHRRRPKQALAYSERAIELLSDKADARRDNPQTEQLVGQLYFHIGALHAVHNQQHAEAVEWYDRAFPLLVVESRTSEFTVPRREGEALVSMAVSYWDQGDKNRAISLSEMGAEMIEQAVAGGVVEETTLAVPYGNLAVMHRKLGNTSESLRYAKLAETMRDVAAETAAGQAETSPAESTEEKPGVAAKPLPKTSATPAGRNRYNDKPRRATRSGTVRR